MRRPAVSGCPAAWSSSRISTATWRNGTGSGEGRTRRAFRHARLPSPKRSRFGFAQAGRPSPGMTNEGSAFCFRTSLHVVVEKRRAIAILAPEDGEKTFVHGLIADPLVAVVDIADRRRMEPGFRGN